ncbi:MAG: PIN domain-containing protein [Pseudomonadota bacterium]
MIVLDTNVIVRVITKDDIEQARQAVELLKGQGPFWVSRVVLLETAWTLKTRYGYTRQQVSRALRVVSRSSVRKWRTKSRYDVRSRCTPRVWTSVTPSSLCSHRPARP